jgi:hypothetical protein
MHLGLFVCYCLEIRSQLHKLVDIKGNIVVEIAYGPGHSNSLNSWDLESGTNASKQY